MMATHVMAIDRELHDIAAGRNKRLIVQMPPRHGKALKTDTPIPTPDGWTTIGELRPGDEVFGDDGVPCRVVAVSPTWKNRVVYRVRTDDGDEIIADGEHEWCVRLCRKHPVVKRKTTSYLAGRTSNRKPMIAAANALHLPERELPIDPYVLGVWLGDGNSRNAVVTTADDEVLKELVRIEGQANVYSSNSRGAASSYRIGPHFRQGDAKASTLQARLRSLGLLRNKHVPIEYLRASQEQRRALLQGLVDTDGFIAADGQVEFCSKRRRLAEDVKELVASLGHKASIVSGSAMCNGKDCGTKYRVMFYMAGAARLTRKAERSRHGKRAFRRYISVDECGVADTVCIQVDSPSHMFLCGRSMLPTHNSELCSKYFPAWYLGVFPNRNVMMASATDELAMEFSTSARDILNEHGGLFGVSLRRDIASTRRWKTKDGGGLRAAGVGGDLMGRGAELLIIDDYFKNIKEALSETTRAKMFQWYLSTSSTRCSPDGAQVIIATRWHSDDLIGRVLKTAAETGEQWRVLSFPAIGDDGAALWPEQWPLSKLEPRRQSYMASGYPWMWEALYQQQPPDTIDAEWPPEYFRDIYVDEVPDDTSLTVVALDPSLGRTDKSDYSAFVRVTKGHNGVYYVDANIARRPTRQIIDDGIDWMRHVKPDAFGCEAVAFQSLLRDMFEERMHECNMDWTRVYGLHNGEGRNTGRVPPKLTRIRLLTPLLAAGRIRMLRSPGSSLLVEQLKGFPSHKHDDGPDALEMAIRLCEELLGGTGYESRDEVLVA